MKTVRELVKRAQVEIRDVSDLQPDRAAELLMTLSALLGNCSDEIRAADAAYAARLLACYEAEETANRAKIRAETSEEYQRKREAHDTRDVALEMIRSLKVFLRVKADELAFARHQ